MFSNIEDGIFCNLTITNKYLVSILSSTLVGENPNTEAILGKSKEPKILREEKIKSMLNSVNF